LRFGEGRECTFAACLALATGAEYDWIMGCSGAAFSAAIDTETWDPIAASPADDPTLSRGARAASARLDPVHPPYDEEMRALVFERVVEAIDEKLPPLVRGVVGPPEFGLLVGYDERGPSFQARTFFDPDERPSALGWDAFIDAQRGGLYFLDRAAAVDPGILAREALAVAIASGDETEKALAAWEQGLQDDERWSDPRHSGTGAFADHAMRTLLADKRHAAARFLRQIRSNFPAPVAPDLLRAAESYGFVAEAAERFGAGAFEPSLAARFLDGGHRRAWAKALATARGHERTARESLGAASAAAG
jgi:hypothetical protein